MAARAIGQSVWSMTFGHPTLPLSPTPKREVGMRKLWLLVVLSVVLPLLAACGTRQVESQPTFHTTIETMRPGVFQ